MKIHSYMDLDYNFYLMHIQLVFVCLFVYLFLFRGNKYKDALEQHKLALEVLKTVTQNHPETHPDYTFYLMNIGT